MRSIPAGAEIAMFSGGTDAHAGWLEGREREDLRNGLVDIYRHGFVRDHYRLAKNKGSPSKKGKAALPLGNASLPGDANVAGDHVNGQCVQSAIANGSGISADLSATLKVLENYRKSEDREPQEEFVDWIFESSLAARLAGPLAKGSDITSCAA